MWCLLMDKPRKPPAGIAVNTSSCLSDAIPSSIVLEGPKLQSNPNQGATAIMLGSLHERQKHAMSKKVCLKKGVTTAIDMLSSVSTCGDEQTKCLEV